MWKSMGVGVLVLVLVVVGVGAAHANEIGSFFLTADYGFGDYELSNSFTTYRVDNLGVSAGFTLPIIKKKCCQVTAGGEPGARHKDGWRADDIRIRFDRFSGDIALWWLSKREGRQCGRFFSFVC